MKLYLMVSFLLQLNFDHYQNLVLTMKLSGGITELQPPLAQSSPHHLKPTPTPKPYAQLVLEVDNLRKERDEALRSLKEEQKRLLSYNSLVELYWH